MKRYNKSKKTLGVLVALFGVFVFAGLGESALRIEQPTLGSALQVVINGEIFRLADAAASESGLEDYSWTRLADGQLRGQSARDLTSEHRKVLQVDGRVAGWSVEDAARFAGEGFLRYEVLAAVAGGDAHRSKVLWLRQSESTNELDEPTMDSDSLQSLQPNWFRPFGLPKLIDDLGLLTKSGAVPGFTHGITLDVNGEAFYLGGVPDGPGGETDIPGHFWIQTGARELIGLHFNTGPFEASSWWSSDASDGALLYVVRGIIDTWSDKKAALYAALGYQHYHELVSVADGSEHPNKVLWLRHDGVGSYILDGGPHPEFAHRVTAAVDREFIPNWYMAYGDAPADLASFQHGPTLIVDNKEYFMAGAPAGQGDATDIPGHHWLQVGANHLVGLHYNSGPGGAASWWTSSAPDGALLYVIDGVIGVWSNAWAAHFAARGYQHYHELVSVEDGSEHPNKVVWLRHTSVTDFILDGGPHPELSHHVFPGLDEAFIPNWYMPYGNVQTDLEQFFHGLKVPVDGEFYVLSGVPDAAGGRTDIPGHAWRYTAGGRLVGLHYNTGPFGDAQWWSSDADDGALLYAVTGIIDTWSDSKAAFYSSRGYHHYHEIESLADATQHPTKVLWLRHTGVGSFTLDGGPHPEWIHQVQPGLDVEFIPNWTMPYANGSGDFESFEHGITAMVDGEPYQLAGVPDGPNGATDIPGHSWIQVSPNSLVGLHFNTGPDGAPSWWSSDADDGSLLYVVQAVIDTWTPEKAAWYAANGAPHYHELVSANDGSLHPDKVVWLTHVAMSEFNLDGGPMPEFAHETVRGLDLAFINNWQMPYGP